MLKWPDMRIVLALLLFLPGAVSAQEFVPDTVVSMKARVLEVISQERREIPGTDTEHLFQTLHVEIVEEPEKGAVVEIQNDFLELEEGDVFYLAHITNPLDGTDRYSVQERYRLPWLLGLLALFIGVVAFFGGRQGIRGLLALVASFAFIAFLLLPGILKGYPPILVSVGVASLIVLIGSYVTHGVSKTTSAAVIGMIATITITGLLAYLALYATALSGFSSDEAIYLNFNTRGTIDFAGLLLGGILIGILGVLYDAAIGQAVAVEELAAVGSSTSKTEIFRRALRIGREHIGALVNTLAIAYTGASLPLILLLYQTNADIGLSINGELIAVELVRILVGSIGVVLTVPVTTAIAVWMLLPRSRAL
jgi:uncharacterized membrane protein